MIFTYFITLCFIRIYINSDQCLNWSLLTCFVAILSLAFTQIADAFAYASYVLLTIGNIKLSFSHLHRRFIFSSWNRFGQFSGICSIRIFEIQFSIFSNYTSYYIIHGKNLKFTLYKHLAKPNIFKLCCPDFKFGGFPKLRN